MLWGSEIVLNGGDDYNPGSIRGQQQLAHQKLLVLETVLQTLLVFGDLALDLADFLVKPLDFSVPGTWGGAEDYFPDMKDFVAKLQWLHDNPSERAAIAARGMAEARSHTWDQAVDVVQANIEKVLERRKKLTAQAPVAFPQAPQTAIMNSSEPLPQSVDGLALVEA